MVIILTMKTAFLILMVFFIQGCATAPHPQVRVDLKSDLESNIDASFSIEVTRQPPAPESPLRLELSSEKKAYKLEEPIRLSYKLENVQDEAMYIFKKLWTHYLLCIKGPEGEVIRYEKELIKGSYLKESELIEIGSGNFYGGRLKPFHLEIPGRYRIRVQAIGCKNLTEELSSLNIWGDALKIDSNSIELIITSN